MQITKAEDRSLQAKGVGRSYSGVDRPQFRMMEDSRYDNDQHGI